MNLSQFSRSNSRQIESTDIAIENQQTVDLTEELRDGLIETLEVLYQKKCDSQNRVINFYGNVLPNEILFIVSLQGKSPQILPVTFYLSADYDKSAIDAPEIFKTKKNQMLDLIGNFLDQYFSQVDWDNYEPAWQDHPMKGDVFYYRSSREDIELTLLADQLLKQ